MPVTFPFQDISDFMRKSVYDKDNDGVVDKIKKLTSVEELATGYSDGDIPKINADGATVWGDDIDGSLTAIDGGIW